MLAWMNALPDAILWQHARLALHALLRVLDAHSWTTEASSARVLAQVEQMMARLEALLHQQEAGVSRSESALTSQDEFLVIQRRLRLLRALIETRTILQSGDKARLAQLAQELEGPSQEEDLSWQMIALAIDFWLTEAFQREGALLLPRLLEAKGQAEQAGDLLSSIRVREWLAFAYLRAGAWQLLERECLAALALLAQSGVRTAWAGYWQNFLADVYYAWNRLDEAAGAIQQALRIAEDWQQVDLLTVGQLYVARNRLARGDLAAADQALSQAEVLVQQERNARLYPVAVFRVRYWLATGELEAAGQWAEHTVFSPDTWDPNDKWAVLTLVQVYLAQHQSLQALETLERFRAQFERPGDRYHTIRFLALSVVALHQAGKREQAQAVLARLLALTEPEGEIRVYLDQGAPMRQALQAFLAPHARQHALAPATAAYVSKLVVAFEDEEHGANRSLVAATTPAPKPALAQVSPSLMAPLTPREQEVLRLLATGASNQEIAQALVITLDTAKKHVSNLLGKLGATSRTQAVAQARARSLL